MGVLCIYFLGILKAPPSKLEVNTTPTAAVEVTGVGPQTTPIRVFQPVQGGSGTESRRNLLHVLLGILKAPPSKLEGNTTPTAAVEVTGVGPQTTPILMFQPVPVK